MKALCAPRRVGFEPCAGCRLSPRNSRACARHPCARHACARHARARCAAEKLYLSGLVSYPRTETCRYAPSFDLRGTLRLLSGQEWLRGVGELNQAAGEAAGEAEGGAGGGTGSALLSRARSDGVDAGDHPPITPVKLGTQKQCGDAVG